MIRSPARAMSFGALIAAAVFWAAVQWPQYPLVVWIGARDQAGQAFPVGETLPLCTAMGSLAADVDWAPLDPDFAAGQKGARRRGLEFGYHGAQAGGVAHPKVEPC